MHNRIKQRGGLWANTDFLLVWAAETVSQFGAQVSIFAVPLIAAITLGATPLEMGVLTAAGRAPQIIFGFFAGAWTDRLPRRPIMIATDIGRVASTAIIPIAALGGYLNFTVLIIATLVTGLQTVFFDTAWGALLPNMVERGELSDATSKLMGSASLAQVIGPALGGLIVGAIGGPDAMWITILTFSLSAWLLTRMRVPEVRATRTGAANTMFGEIGEGLRELWREPVVRALMNSSMVLNFGGYVFLAVYVLFMTNDLALGSQGVGLVFASGGIGALIGAAAAPRIATMIGIGPSILWGAIAFGIANMPVPLAFYFPDIALPAVISAEFLAWLSLMVYNVNRFALRQAITPNHLRGRIGASSGTMISGAILLGSLAGGVIGDIWGVHMALWVGIIIMALAAIWVWRSPVPGMFEIPEDVNSIQT